MKRPGGEPVTEELLSQVRQWRDKRLSKGLTAGHVLMCREFKIRERTAKRIIRILNGPPLRIITEGVL